MTSVIGQAKADFLEYSRRFSFIAMIALALFGAFFFVPSYEQGNFSFLEIMPDTFIQTSNATWIPVAGAMGTGFFLLIFGFFYLRNSIIFDEKTGIDQFIITSPAKNISYVMGKFISGILLLSFFAIITMLGSYIMILLRFSNEALSLRTFFVPYAFLITSLPIISAIAVFFGSFRLLRGAVGSVIFIIGVFVKLNIIMDVNTFPRTLTLFQRSFDFTGMIYLQDIIKFALLDTTGDYAIRDSAFLGGIIELAGETPTEHLFFITMPLGVYELTGFGLMLSLAFGLVIVSVPLLLLSRRLRSIKTTDIVSYSDRTTNKYIAAKATVKQNQIAGIAAELKLMIKGQSLAWKLVALTGVVSSIFVDLVTVQILIIPLVLLWFINAFSSLGYKERYYDILQIISTIPRGRFRQIIYSYTAGLCISFILLCPVTIRMILAGQIYGVFIALSAMVFVPSLALFLGEVTKSNRPFEMLMIFVTYMILNGEHFIDYVGLHPNIVSITRGTVFLLLGVILGIFAVVKRVSTHNI